jgi:hypothetical protein
MPSQKINILIGILLVVTAGGGLFYLYQEKETEKRIRIQKEQQLAAKIKELTDTMASLAAVKKEKADLESELTSQINALEIALRNSDQNGKILSEKVDGLTLANESFKKDLAEREAKLADLSKKVKNLQMDKLDLMAMIRKYEESGGSPASPSKTSSKVGADLETVPVNLGKIVIKKSSGKAVRVEEINTVYGYIVVNAGSRDGITKDTVLNIVRDNELVGKAVVQKVEQEVSAAVILKEWMRDEVRIGDTISRL